MRRFNTEAIRVVIPVVGELEDDDVKSFIAGINLGMRKHFAGKSIISAQPSLKLN